MSNIFKIALISLIVVSIAAASLAVFAFIGKEREYMKRVLLEDKLAAALKEKRGLEKSIKANEKAKEAAEKKVKEAEIQIESFTVELKQIKEKNLAAVEDLEAKKEEIEKIKSILEKEKKEKLAISKKIDDLEFENDKAQSEIVRLKKEKVRLERNLSETKKKQVNLDKIVVKPDMQGERSVPAMQVKYQSEQEDTVLRGRVLVVNKEYNFVVTDLGEDDGVAKGMNFELRDGTEFVAKAEVDKVYETMSSASILPGGSMNRVRKGTLVIESR